MATDAWDLDSLTRRLKTEAHRLGFVWSGVCAAVEPTGVSRLAEWIQQGFAGEMEYFAKRLDAYQHPRHVLDGVQSLVVLAFPYRNADPLPAIEGQGRVARYAWGTLDYHDLLHDRLKQLNTWLVGEQPLAVNRGTVDTAPLLEREFAELAGLGWRGKNTLLLNKRAGSYFFLATLLTNLPLVVDEPHTAHHCGTCRACLDACPTQAFPSAGVLDARRCISYLTIEHRSPIPVELRQAMGDWVFGCDVCQEVCPWNSKSPVTEEASLQPDVRLRPLDLIELFFIDDDEFRRRFKKTPLWRPRRRGILRNAAIVLGNQRSELALPALHRGLIDLEPLIRGASAWALGEFNTVQTRRWLSERLAIEVDPYVREEITRGMEVPSP